MLQGRLHICIEMRSRRAVSAGAKSSCASSFPSPTTGPCNSPHRRVFILSPSLSPSRHPLARYLPDMTDLQAALEVRVVG
jgi:hypothetical protein